jgi:hypothetical protein
LSHIDWPSQLLPVAAGLALIVVVMASPLVLFGRIWRLQPS